MLILDADIQTEQAAELDELFALCFDGMYFMASPKARFRAINAGSPVRMHAAVDIRKIKLGVEIIDVALLGFVCVHPDIRGARQGYRMIHELHKAVDLPFILNCGSGLVPYYTKFGYKLISESASYDRHGGVEIDEDPVLMFSNGHDIDIGFRKEPIHLGSDF